MTDSFNSYQEWLGISAPDQVGERKNFYQLLGIDEFSSDTGAIAQAADRQLSKVRSFRPGEHARQWAALLDELNEAKKTLTNPEQKAAFDELLKNPPAVAATSPAASPEVPTNSPPPPASPPTASDPPTGGSESSLAPPPSPAISSAPAPATSESSTPLPSPANPAQLASPAAPNASAGNAPAVNSPVTNLPEQPSLPSPTTEAATSQPTGPSPTSHPDSQPQQTSAEATESTIAGPPGFSNYAPQTPDGGAPASGNSASNQPNYGNSYPANPVAISPTATSDLPDPMAPVSVSESTQQGPLFANLHSQTESPAAEASVTASPTSYHATVSAPGSGARAVPVGPRPVGQEVETTGATPVTAAVGPGPAPLPTPVDSPPTSVLDRKNSAKSSLNNSQMAFVGILLLGVGLVSFVLGRASVGTPEVADRSNPAADPQQSEPSPSSRTNPGTAGQDPATQPSQPGSNGNDPANDPGESPVENGSDSNPAQDPPENVDGGNPATDPSTTNPMTSGNSGNDGPMPNDPDPVSPTNPLGNPDVPTVTPPEMSGPDAAGENTNPPAESTPPVPEPEQPAPTPEPAEPVANQETVAELQTAIQAAVTAMREKNMELADTQLAAAQNLAVLSEHKGKVMRLKTLSAYLGQYYRAVEKALEMFEGEDIEVGTSTIIKIIEVTPTELKIRNLGRNQNFPRDQIPAGLEKAELAARWLDDADPLSKVVLGSIHAIQDDPKQKQKARDFWQEAQLVGEDTSSLMPVLDDKYDNLADDLP